MFGTLIERRFGPVPVVLVFVLAGAAGAALAVALEMPPLFEDSPICPVLGANGAALGLLCAWLVDDRLAARRGDDRENDLLGVYVVRGRARAAARWRPRPRPTSRAAVGGALAGAVLGLRCRSSRAERVLDPDVFTDEQVEAAVQALSDPERFAGAERAGGGDGAAAAADPGARAGRGRLVRRRLTRRRCARRRRARTRAAASRGAHAAGRGDPDGNAGWRGRGLGARP